MKRLLLLLACAFPAWAVTDVLTINFKELYGVHHVRQTVEMPYTGAYVPPATSRILAPNGVDVLAFQQLLPARAIAIQTSLPQSVVNAVVTQFQGASSSGDWLQFANTGNAYQAGMMVYFTDGGGTNTCGLTNATIYFIQSYLGDSKFKLTATLGGSAIDLTTTACGTTPKLTLTGITIDGATDVIRQVANHRSDREPVKFRGAALSGTGITAGTQYFIRDATADTYKIALTVGGSAVALSDLTTGLTEVETDWTWTVQTETTPGGSVTNPVTIDRTNASYFQIANGVTAGRVGRFTNPTGTYTKAGGTLTSCVNTTNVVVCTGLPPGHLFVDAGPVTMSGERAGVKNIISTVTSHTATTITFPAPGAGNFTASGTYLTLINANLSSNPLQGIRLATGEWIGTGSLLYIADQGLDNGTLFKEQTDVETKPTPYNWSYRTTFVDVGPLKTTIKAAFTTYRPIYVNGSDVLIAGTNTEGQGVFSLTFTFYADRKGFLLAESTDLQYGMSFDAYTGWPAGKPDRRKWRWGGGALPLGDCANTMYVGLGVTAATHATPIVLTVPNSYLYSGSGALTITGVGGNTAANVTAHTAFTVSGDQITLTGIAGNGAYTSGGLVKATSFFVTSAGEDRDGTEDLTYSGTRIVSTNCSATERPAMGVWQNVNPYGGHSQWVYNFAGSSTAPVFAIAAGRASLAAPGNVAHPAYAGFASTAAPMLKFTWLTAPTFDGGLGGRELMIFTGTKADINSETSPNAISALTLEQNLLAGINLTKIFGIEPLFADPPGGWVPAMMSAAAVAEIARQYRENDPAGTTAILNSSAGNRNSLILAIMAGTTSATIDAALLPFKSAMLVYMTEAILRDGIFSPGLAGSGIDSTIAHIANLHFQLCQSFITDAQKIVAKGYAALLAGLAVDTDVYNVLTDSGGTANQTIAIAASIDISAVLFGSHPKIALRLPTTLAQGTALIASSIRADGASATSSHYDSTLQPSFQVVLSQKELYSISPDRYPRLALFCDFVMDTLTPPEPRFGGVARKRIAIGDAYGSESSNLLGLCATVFDGVTGYTDVAARSIAGWRTMNTATIRTYDDSQFFPDMTAIQTGITSGTLALGTKNWVGYLQAMRHNYGTANESACWMVSGNHYSDHAHPDDGSLACYFLKVPVFVDAASTVYNPHTSSKLIHNGPPVLDSELTGGQTWNGDLVNFEAPIGRWGTMVQCQTLFFSKFSVACVDDTDATGTVWRRLSILSAFNASLPVLTVLDTFTGGDNAGDSKTLSWLPLFDGNAIATPWGDDTPTARLVEESTGPTTMPSGGSSHALAGGAQAFSLIGPTMPVVSSIAGNGLDLDFGFVEGSAASVALGAMTFQATSSREEAEFQTANSTAFTSTHAWIRIHDTGAFTSWWAPHFKNVTPSRTFAAITGGISVVTTSPVTTTETFTATELTGTDGTVQCLVALDTASHTAFGFTISGGPQEICKLSSSSYTWTVTGNEAGTRVLVPPVVLFPNKSVVFNDLGNYEIYHPGVNAATGQAVPTVVALSTTPAVTYVVPLQTSHPTAASLRIRFGSATEFVANTPCTPVCEVDVTSTVGVKAVSFEFLNGGGAVISAGGQSTHTVP